MSKTKKVVDPTEAALSAIEEALKLDNLTTGPDDAKNAAASAGDSARARPRPPHGRLSRPIRACLLS